MKHFKYIKEAKDQVACGRIEIENEPFTYRKNLIVKRVVIYTDHTKVNCLLKSDDEYPGIKNTIKIKAVIRNNFLYSYEIENE